MLNPNGFKNNLFHFFFETMPYHSRTDPEPRIGFSKCLRRLNWFQDHQNRYIAYPEKLIYFSEGFNFKLKNGMVKYFTEKERKSATQNE